MPSVSRDDLQRDGFILADWEEAHADVCGGMVFAEADETHPRLAPGEAEHVLHLVRRPGDEEVLEELRSQLAHPSRLVVKDVVHTEEGLVDLAERVFSDFGSGMWGPYEALLVTPEVELNAVTVAVHPRDDSLADRLSAYYGHPVTVCHWLDGGRLPDE